MFKKILVFAVCLVSLSFFSIASAEMRLVTKDTKGYETYFDTDSIEMESEEVLTVRVVGKDPKGWTIMDGIFKFKFDEESRPYCSALGGDWRLLETDEDTVILKAILEYMYGGDEK